MVYCKRTYSRWVVINKQVHHVRSSPRTLVVVQCCRILQVLYTPEAASAPTATAIPCRTTATATQSGPGTGRNRGGISSFLDPASDSIVAPTTPTPRPAAKAALLSSSEGEAAAATTASRPAGAEGPTTGAGCPAANAATNPIGSGSYGSEPAQ